MSVRVIEASSDFHIAGSAFQSRENAAMPGELGSVVARGLTGAGEVTRRFEPRRRPGHVEIAVDLDGFELVLVCRLDRGRRWWRLVEATARPIGE